jgi:hypothetical protein
MQSTSINYATFSRPQLFSQKFSAMPIEGVRITTYVCRCACAPHKPAESTTYLCLRPGHMKLKSESIYRRRVLPRAIDQGLCLGGCRETRSYTTLDA